MDVFLPLSGGPGNQQAPIVYQEKMLIMQKLVKRSQSKLTV